MFLYDLLNYGGEMKKTSYGTKIMKMKMKRQNDVINFIYDLIDHLDKKPITYHK